MTCEGLVGAQKGLSRVPPSLRDAAEVVPLERTKKKKKRGDKKVLFLFAGKEFVF